MARPSSFTKIQKEQKAQLQARFEQKRKQLTVSKDNKYKKAMFESVLKEYAKHLYTHLENNTKEKIMEQVSVAINRVMDAYPRMLATSDWNDIYKKINELNLWDEALVKDKIKFNFLKNKAVMDNDGLISMPDSNTTEASDIKINDDLANVNPDGSTNNAEEMQPSKAADDAANNQIDDDLAIVNGATNKAIFGEDDLLNRTDDNAQNAADNQVDTEMAEIPGTETLHNLINKRLNYNTRMYVEGYYNLIVSAMKSANSADPWFMTL